jgi:hypothetical protein
MHRAPPVHPTPPDSCQSLDRCLQAWVANLFNCSGVGGIIVDATNVAPAGTDVSDGSITPTTEDRFRLAIVINCDPNAEYRVQEKSRWDPGKASGIPN